MHATLSPRPQSPFRVVPFVTMTLAMALTSAPSLADMLPGPPRGCPPGSIGKSGPEGQWCEPVTCASNAECPARTDVDMSISTREQEITYSCEAAGVCVHEQEMVVRKKVWPPRKDSNTIEFVDGAHVKHLVASKSCSSDADCGGKGEKCETAPRCLEATRRFKDDGGVVYFFKPQAKNVPKPETDKNAATQPSSVPTVQVADTTQASKSDGHPTVSGERCTCDLVGGNAVGSSMWLVGMGAFAYVLRRRRS